MDVVFNMAFWGIFLCLYFGPALYMSALRTFRGKRLLNLGGLSSVSQGLCSVVGLVNALPKTAWGCYSLGVVLILIGFTPLLFLWLLMIHLVGPIDELVRSVLGPGYVTPVIGTCMIVLFFLTNRCLRSGWSLMLLPKQCRNAGWKLNDWVERTCATPSHNDALLEAIWESQYYGAFPAAVFAFGCQIGAFAALCAAFAMVPIPLVGYLIGCSVCAFLLGFSRRLRRHINKRLGAFYSHHLVPDPVIYLRAFGSDEALSKSEGKFQVATIEESIMLALQSSGHRVLSLGRPGEPYPPLGADRYYVKDDEWQSTISKWLVRSHAIIMVAAETRATQWEIEQIFRLGVHSKFLILFVDTTGSSAWVSKTPFFESLTKTTIGRLSDAGVRDEELEQAVQHASADGSTDCMVAMAFEDDGHPILITGPNRQIYTLKESVKWQLQRLHPNEIRRASKEVLMRSLLFYASVIVISICVLSVPTALIWWRVHTRDSQPWRTYMHETTGASFKVPQWWGVEEENKAFNIDPGATLPGLYFVDFVETKNFERWIFDYFHRGWGTLQSSTFKDVAEVRWKCDVYRVKSPSVDEPWRCLVYSRAVGQTTAILTVAGDPATVAYAEPMIEKVLATFSFKK